MVLNALPSLLSAGRVVPTGPDEFGWLRSSNDALADPEELRRRMQEDGYLFLPGFFEREKVVEVRQAILRELAKCGALDPNAPLEDAIASRETETYFNPDIANKTEAREPIRNLIYGDRMMGFFDAFLGEKSMHYDFTWLRTVGPGLGTWPHCDVVYMGRGTKDLYTAWVPFSDIPLTVGGLILKEKSNHDREYLETYCTMDVDTACANEPGQHQLNAHGYPGFGALADGLDLVRKDAGGRWLTSPEFRMGDLLLFTVFTVHGSLDNQSDVIRISTDSRYQRASEPADERWIGENPPGHGGDMVQKMIC